MDSVLPCSRVPIVFLFQCTASTGQTRAHPVQEWQSSGKIRTLLGRTASALYAQNFEHAPQCVHRVSSIIGMVTLTSSVCCIEVYIGATGTVQQAIDDYTNGKLQKATTEHACQQHAFRNQHHHD